MFAPNYMCKRQSLSNIWITWIRVCEMKKRKGGWLVVRGRTICHTLLPGITLGGEGATCDFHRLFPPPTISYQIFTHIFRYYKYFQIFTNIFRYFQIITDISKYFQIFPNIGGMSSNIFRYLQIFTCFLNIGGMSSNSPC